MPRYAYPTRHVPQLLDELHAAGLTDARVYGPGDGSGTPTWVEVAAADEPAARAVVQAHDPAAYDQRKADAQSAYDDAIAYLKNYRTLPSPTNQQTVNATKALIDVAKTQHQQLRDAGAG